jgi:hypothetical protein
VMVIAQFFAYGAVLLFSGGSLEPRCTRSLSPARRPRNERCRSSARTHHDEPPLPARSASVSAYSNWQNGERYS